MAKHDDSLFLLEVLIDKIVFTKSPCFSDKDFRTCVNIECPAVQPLEICDDDPGICIARSGGPFVKTFNNGKSCLFSLKEADISAAMSKFPVKVSVYKSLPCGCLPTKIVMGEATIDMTKEFVQARNKFLEDPSNVSYQALKDSFRIIGPDGAESGEIIMFLRISCFGKLIITKFQGGGGAPNLGAGGSNTIVDRSCSSKRDFQTAKDPCACGAARGGSGKAGSGKAGSGYGKQSCVSSGGGVCHAARDPYNSMPCEDPDDPCFCSGPMQPAKQDMACRNTDQYCLHVPKGRSKQFEEIGTNLGGNELKIKVPASASIIKKISQTHCAMQCPYTKGTDGGPCEPPCGKNQISLALPTEDICCQGAQPAGTQFTCTTEGCLQASKHVQQIALARGDAKQQDIPNKEVFVLKVAKTAMQGDRKCKLELELVTPKGPDKKPPVEKVNTRLQSDLDCECCIRRLKKPKGKKKHCCPTGNKVVFQLPSDSCGTGHKQRAHFNFTSDGVGDVARDEPGQLMPITAEDYPGVVYDFPKQVIKLRIGKTVEMPGRKSKLEYQFITPVITHERVVPVKDTRTAQCTPCCRSPCCSSRPKCVPPCALYRQELTGERWNEIKTKGVEQDQQHLSEFITAFVYEYNNAYPECKINHQITECLRCIINKIEQKGKLQDTYSTSMCSTKYTNLNSSLSSLLKTFRNQDSSCSTSYDGITFNNTGMFGNRETEVYMNLFNDFSHYRASGTQATAFINKCLQVNSQVSSRCDASTIDINSNFDSTCTVSTVPAHQTRRRTIESGQYHDVYFFGRKKDSSKSAGMGYKESKIKIHRTEQTSGAAGRRGSSSVINSACVQTKNTKGASTATSTMKAVSIKEDKPKKPCPAAGQTKGDMTATISHIRIGPREPCPVHGKEPCQGPKCIVASSGEEQAPVKVSTVTNPRRGVFEIVIRKMTGAPLAKNELMLEWTPPPSRPPPCGVPCPIPCAIPTPCRPPKCKMIVCRPSKCIPKCCKKPCSPSPCKRCRKTSCCGKKCTPCGPPACKIPCSTPCCASPCSSPCKSSPCLRPCPVGRKRPRKSRSQPKIRANRKRTSPCLNRSKACPVVRCRSMPGPCVGCCFVPPCPPRKCCSVAPCKPPKCCKSSCSMCCP